MGGKEDFTEKDLSPSYKKELKGIATEALSKGKDKITYADYEGDTMDKSLIKNLFSKNYNLKTLIGSGKITINDNGEIIVTDKFNFNDAKDAQSVTELLHMVSEIGGAALRNEKYNLVRKVGKWYGSGEGKGQFVNINLGDYRQYLNEGALDEVKLPEPKPKGLMEKS